MRVGPYYIITPLEDAHAYDVDWRSQVANALHKIYEANASGERVAESSVDRSARTIAATDPLLRTQTALLRTLGTAPDSYKALYNVADSRRRCARALHPAALTALQLHLLREEFDLSPAHKLQAALLTSEPLDVIASDLGMSKPEVQTYLGLYWDCRANTGRPAWVVAHESAKAMKLTRNSSVYDRCLNVALYEGYEELREIMALPASAQSSPGLRKSLERRVRMVVADRMRNDDGFTGDLVAALGHGLAERKLAAEDEKGGSDQQALVSVVQQVLSACVPTALELAAPAKDALSVASEVDLAEQWTRRRDTYEAGVNSHRQIGDDVLKSSKAPVKAKPKAPKK